MEYPLCSICIERHQKHPGAKKANSDSECFVCKGAFPKIFSLADSALAVAQEQKFEWSNFTVRSTIKREMLVREEELFDVDLADSISAKNQLNRIVAGYVSQKSGKKFSTPAADIAFCLDFWHGTSSAVPSSLFLFARYRKLSRQYCQHIWTCQKCRGRGCKACDGKGENYPSVEGAIRSVFAPLFGASDAVLHASGREDVDVIMEGNGRPCVIELVHPRIRRTDLASAARTLSSSHPIELDSLRICQPYWVEAVCTSHFEKTYRAWVDAGRSVTGSELESVCNSIPLQLFQRTPMRVSQRRSDLVRKRKILTLCVASHSGSEIVLDLKTEAGTYIKEFVHGDGGRTVPSLSSIFHSDAACKQLNVIRIHDEFVESLS